MPQTCGRKSLLFCPPSASVHISDMFVQGLKGRTNNLSMWKHAFNFPCLRELVSHFKVKRPARRVKKMCRGVFCYGWLSSFVPASHKDTRHVLAISKHDHPIIIFNIYRYILQSIAILQPESFCKVARTGAIRLVPMNFTLARA